LSAKESQATQINNSQHLETVPTRVRNKQTANLLLHLPRKTAMTILRRFAATSCQEQWTPRTVRVILFLCLYFPLFLSADSNEQPKREPKRLISLAESISKTTNSLQDPSVDEMRKQYWQKTLADIRNISLGFTRDFNISDNGEGYSLGQQWKLGIERNPTVILGPQNDTETITTLDLEAGSITDTTSRSATLPMPSKRGRFEGFMSWDRMLQEWAEDVQEYLDEVERESSEMGYSFANFGRSAVPAKSDEGSNDLSAKSLVLETTKHQALAESSESRSKSELEPKLANEKSRKHAINTAPLPLPSPAEPGEAVLPHTDLSDLSKRVEIVTTASLPWRTGTAVNPLLRAAYLTHGRADAGGSVTLMLPWLERRTDQERVYGESQTFESPNEQEGYIRDWLRNTANMPEAADNLRIRWYTAWQNPAENSIYSMGDITALIPPEEVDICILEEPEHLNWYRAPGESWTKRFKHVVGILHTSEYYFV
jgi:hypothetical protein